MSDEEVQVQFGADTQQIVSGINDVKGHLVDMGREVDKAEELFKYLAERMLEVFALREISEFVEKITEVGEQIERMSALTGLSGEFVQQLGFAMERTGGDAESAGSSILRLERNIEQAASGSGIAYKAFTRLRVSLDDLQHSPVDVIMQKMAVGFSNLSDAATRSAVANDAGGRSLAQMVPALLEMAQNANTFKDKLNALNDNLSEKTVKALSDTHKELTDLGRAFQGAGVEAFLTFKGAIDGLITDLTAAVVVIGEFIGHLRELQVVAGVDVVIAVGRMVDAVESFAERAKFAASDVMIRWKEMGAVITEVATLNWSAIADVEKEADAQIQDAFNNEKKNLKGVQDAYDNLKKSATDAGAAILQAYKDKQTADKRGDINRGTSKGDNSEALSDIATEEQLNKIELQMEKDKLAEKVAMGTISKAQELEMEKGFIDQEHANDITALSEKLDLYDEGSKKYNATLNQMLIADAKYEEAKQKLALQTAIAQKKQADEYAKVFTNATDQMLAGVLQGTQTWQQALSRAFDNIALAFVEKAVNKIVTSWIDAELSKTSATETGDAIRTASTIGASATAAAAEGAAAKGSIGSSAARGAAAVYADVAEIPYVGWLLAPPAAAAAFVGIEAFGSGIGSFDIGSNYVPMDGLAMLHQGETVIPASSQGPGYSGGHGDSYNITIAVSAMDGPSVAQLFKNNGTAIAASLVTQMRNGNRSLATAMKGN